MASGNQGPQRTYPAKNPRPWVRQQKNITPKDLFQQGPENTLESLAALSPDKDGPYHNITNLHHADVGVVVEKVEIAVEVEVEVAAAAAAAVAAAAAAAAAKAATPENENSGDHNHVAAVPQPLHRNLTGTWLVIYTHARAFN